MSKSKLKKVALQEPVQPNLVPMVDIMFLLLLFFILGADMTQREMADLVLPYADQVKENPPVRVGDELIVNIQHSQDIKCAVNAQGRVCREQDHWVLVIRGHEYTKAAALEFLKEYANEPARLEKEIDPQAGKLLSGLKVIIRGDRLAPYGDVNKVVELCGQANVYKIEVGAAQPPPS